MFLRGVLAISPTVTLDDRIDIDTLPVQIKNLPEQDHEFRNVARSHLTLTVSYIYARDSSHSLSTPERYRCTHLWLPNQLNILKL